METVSKSNNPMLTNKEIALLLKDNEESHLLINEMFVKIANRLKDIEEAIGNLPTPDKTYYKPVGGADHITLKENLDNIYSRLNELENGMHK